MSDKLQENIDATVKRLADQDPDYAFLMRMFLNEPFTKTVLTELNIFEDSDDTNEVHNEVITEQ